MRTTYEVGDLVIAAMAPRNDGTYPGAPIRVGEVLVEEGIKGTENR